MDIDLDKDVIAKIVLDYPLNSNLELCKKYNVTAYYIKNIAITYNLKKEMSVHGKVLDDLDLEIFKKDFPISKNCDLAEKYKVTESTIRIWAGRLGLSKKNWSWQPWEEDFVLEFYKSDKYTTKDIAQKLERSVFSVINKYRELKGLR